MDGSSPVYEPDTKQSSGTRRGRHLLGFVELAFNWTILWKSVDEVPRSRNFVGGEQKCFARNSANSVLDDGTQLVMNGNSPVRMTGPRPKAQTKIKSYEFCFTRTGLAVH